MADAQLAPQVSEKDSQKVTPEDIKENKSEIQKIQFATKNIKGLPEDLAAKQATIDANTKDITTKLDAAQKGAASGVASLNAQTKVVENPANAQTTAAASKIPIADTNGKLDSWISANAAAAIASLRALGTTATTACAGNDSRLSDARTPVAHGNSLHTSTFITQTDGDARYPLKSSCQVQFFGLGLTPVGRQTAITKPVGGYYQDAEGRTAINKIIDYLKAFGLTG